eukprot:GHVS01096793.1.p1 GENE.GHVS01096793.1~~GHVS01096793.1.p1  ORF type:complete len:738 (+),score=135.04 GHVS01096793.1:501-2714(+)
MMSMMARFYRWVMAMTFLGAHAAVEPIAMEAYSNSAWAVYQQQFMPWDMDFTRLTHILYGPFQVNRDCAIESGSSVSTDGYVDFDMVFTAMGMAEGYTGARGLVGAFHILRSWATQNGFGFKLIASIGGERHSGYYSRCADIVYRATLVTAVAEFVDEHDFDGVHFDWQYPNESDDFNKLVHLVADTKGVLGGNATVSSEQGMKPDNIDAGDSRITDVADFVVLHTFDYNRYVAEEAVATGVNAPLRAASVGDRRLNIEWGLQRLVQKGFRPDKLVLGISASGRCWSGVPGGPNDDGLFEQGLAACMGTHQPGEVKYFDLADSGGYAEFDYFYDGQTQTPYAFRESVFVSFDDERSVLHKAAFAKQHGLAGVHLVEAADDLLVDNRGDVQLIRGLGAVRQYALLSAAVGGWRGDMPNLTYDRISFLGHRVAGNANSDYVLAAGVGATKMLNIDMTNNMSKRELLSGVAYGDVHGVFVNGDFAALGCIYCGVGGKVFVFNMATNSLMYSVDSPDPELGSDFGMTVGIFRGLLVVGAPGTTVYGLPNVGSVYVFSVATGQPNGNAGTRLPLLVEGSRFGSWLTTSDNNLYIRMKATAEAHQYVSRGPGVFPSGIVMTTPTGAEASFGTRMAAGGYVLAMCDGHTGLCASYSTMSTDVLSQWSVGGEVMAVAVNPDSMQVAVTTAGHVLGFDALTGNQIWSYNNVAGTFGASVTTTITGEFIVGAPVTDTIYFIDTTILV